MRNRCIFKGNWPLWSKATSHVMQMITTPHTELEVNKESVSRNLEMYGSVGSPFKKKKQLPHTLHPRLFFSALCCSWIKCFQLFPCSLQISCVWLPLLLLPASVFSVENRYPLFSSLLISSCSRYHQQPCEDVPRGAEEPALLCSRIWRYTEKQNGAL